MAEVDAELPLGLAECLLVHPFEWSALILAVVQLSPDTELRGVGSHDGVAGGKPGVCSGKITEIHVAAVGCKRCSRFGGCRLECADVWTEFRYARVVSGLELPLCGREFQLGRVDVGPRGGVYLRHDFAVDGYFFRKLPTGRKHCQHCGGEHRDCVISEFCHCCSYFLRRSSTMRKMSASLPG